jgi:hypothetical protein
MDSAIAARANENNGSNAGNNGDPSHERRWREINSFSGNLLLLVPPFVNCHAAVCPPMLQPANNGINRAGNRVPNQSVPPELLTRTVAHAASFRQAGEDGSGGYFFGQVEIGMIACQYFSRKFARAKNADYSLRPPVTAPNVLAHRRPRLVAMTATHYPLLEESLIPSFR